MDCSYKIRDKNKMTGDNKESELERENDETKKKELEDKAKDFTEQYESNL